MKRILLFIAAGLVLSQAGHALMLFQRPTPTVVGGATSAGGIVSFLTDAAGVPTVNITSVGSIGIGTVMPSTLYLANGTNLDQSIDVSLVNYVTAGQATGRNTKGAIATEKGPRWSINSSPTAGVQATATIAGESGVRHVADCLTYSAGATTNNTALGAAYVNLRDGASGAGAVLWSYLVTYPGGANPGVPGVSICGLGLVGSTSAAMTLEFSGSQPTTFQNVSLTGFNIN